MRKKSENGQALVMLLFFVMVGMIITTAAIFIIAGNSLSAGRAEMGIVARQMADAGVENALLQILRGNYAHEDITLPDGTVSVDVMVSNGVPTLVTSTAKAGSHVKKVEVSVGYVNNVLTVGSWKEVD
jgi:hypothetical protein